MIKRRQRKGEERYIIGKEKEGVGLKKAKVRRRIRRNIIGKEKKIGKD